MPMSPARSATGLAIWLDGDPLTSTHEQNPERPKPGDGSGKENKGKR